MKIHIALLVGLACVVTSTAAFGSGTVSVRGTIRKDGTYVPPHVRTAPNSTRVDNWSSIPNTNPYTGKAGTVDPFAPKPYSPFKPYRKK